MDSVVAAQNVRIALKELWRATEVLARAVAEPVEWPAMLCRHEHGKRPAPAHGPDARRAAAMAFRSIDFHDEQDEKRVVRYAGAVAVSPQTLNAARSLNLAKAAFGDAVRCYRNLTSRRERDSQQVRDLLIRFGAARLSLVQAYRTVPILDSLPSRIGYCWAMGTNQVNVLGRDAAIGRIDDEHASAAERQSMKQAVSRTHPDHLRLVEPVAPHIRANVTWMAGQQRRARSVHAPLPLLYLFSAGLAAPIVVGLDRPEPDPRTRKQRQRRSDARMKPIDGLVDVFKI
jgi:hypothetical protein